MLTIEELRIVSAPTPTTAQSSGVHLTLPLAPNLCSDPPTAAEPNVIPPLLFLTCGTPFLSMLKSEGVTKQLQRR